MTDRKHLTADEIRENLIGTTPGPWASFQTSTGVIGICTMDDVPREIARVASCQEDCDLIELTPDLARTAFAAMKEVERLRTENTALTAELVEIRARAHVGDEIVAVYPQLISALHDRRSAPPPGHCSFCELGCNDRDLMRGAHATICRSCAVLAAEHFGGGR